MTVIAGSLPTRPGLLVRRSVGASYRCPLHWRIQKIVLGEGSKGGLGAVPQRG